MAELHRCPISHQVDEQVSILEKVDGSKSKMLDEFLAAGLRRVSCHSYGTGLNRNAAAINCIGPLSQVAVSLYLEGAIRKELEGVILSIVQIELLEWIREAYSLPS